MWIAAQIIWSWEGLMRKVWDHMETAGGLSHYWGLFSNCSVFLCWAAFCLQLSSNSRDCLLQIKVNIKSGCLWLFRCILHWRICASARNKYKNKGHLTLSLPPEYFIVWMSEHILCQKNKQKSFILASCTHFFYQHLNVGKFHNKAKCCTQSWEKDYSMSG